jgi:hypothetical protein
MKKTLLGLLSIATLVTIGFTSCKKDDETTAAAPPFTLKDNQAGHTYGTDNLVFKSDTIVGRNFYELSGGRITIYGYKGDPVNINATQYVLLEVDQFKTPFNGTYNVDYSDTSDGSTQLRFMYFGTRRDANNLANIPLPGSFIKGSFEIKNYNATTKTLDATYSFTQRINNITTTISNGKFQKVKAK